MRWRRNWEQTPSQMAAQSHVFLNAGALKKESVRLLRLGISGCGPVFSFQKEKSDLGILQCF